jgi:hypothetical protein
MGIAKPIMTAPPRPTISKVPTMGFWKRFLKHTSATVRNMIKRRAAPEITCIHLLSFSMMVPKALSISTTSLSVYVYLNERYCPAFYKHYFGD